MPSSRVVTKPCRPSGSTAMLAGVGPVGSVAVTASVSASMTDNVLSPTLTT